MIILLNPRSARWKHRLPLSVLSIGAVLEGRYRYSIIDGNLESDVRGTLIRTIREENVRYLAVTVMPGPQLVAAIQLSRDMKELFPALTVVWGGYFASLHTDVVLRSGFVDYVVRGRGEMAFPDLIRSLEEGRPVDVIAGLSYVKDGRVRHNPAPAAVDPNTLPPIPYSSVDVERYLPKTVLGSRTMVYHSSFGCPFLCGFCAVASVYKGSWMGRDAGYVVQDVIELRDRYRIDAVEFMDNNFFVAEKRTAEIAAGLVGQRVAWWGEARPDTVMHYSDATWRLMSESGCRMMFFGVESSSDETLALMEKGGTQTAALVLDLAVRMKRFGIIPEFSFVLGSPSDDVAAGIERDIRYIRRIKEVNPASEIIIYVYSPVSFDDAALLQRAKGFGFEFPQKLTDWLDEKWENFDLRKNPRTPWLKPSHVARILDFERVLNARYPTISDIKLKRWQAAALRTLGSWRYFTQFYRAPWEIRFVANRLFRYQQPETEGF
jgi:anaerobic magnesium-protoporphyrin IX monomethyl ester cyclase